MILAGTSERGVCAECGAPWVRETETEYDPIGDPARQNAEPRANAKVVAGKATNPGPASMTHGRATKHTRTLGWNPSCECDCEPVPAIILDPFSGTGTSLLVARQLGRRSIGIELNERYCAMTRARLAQLSLLADVVS
jgi:site-specific DNA-methyltransferase (adenine-specific)